MKLVMTGLNHKLAELDIREQFAVTKERSVRVLSSIKNGANVGGCVLISTCNRTELYASVSENYDFEPTEALCAALGRGYRTFKLYFTERSGIEAFRHLCCVTSGVDSQIFGDDQIITQTREALELSRSAGCTDGYCETAFRLAVQAGKSVRTNVILRYAGSVPGQTVEKIKTMCDLPGKNTLVIGNGQMGRLTAEFLMREQVNVTVTLREYKNGSMQVPDGAMTVGYTERYSAVANADIVVSATSSPHFTLQLSELTKLPRLPGIIVDLAVPRDVEPAVGELPGVTLLTVDGISGGSRELPPGSTGRIEKIISEHTEKYLHWLAYKENGGILKV